MNWYDLRSIVDGECGIIPDLPVLLGVSGGPDSLVLLDILHRLEYPLVIAHFDHGLRPESGEDAKAVENIVRKMELPFVTGQGDVNRLAKENHLSLEEAARKARYRFLFNQARQVGAQAVAVAHTADDQVETVLMHLLRGAGLNGLKGMNFRSTAPEWDASIPLVRPLLGVWRSEVLNYCQERSLEPHFDPSNQDTFFFRNRLRHELIPTLESYNPQVRQVIWRMARSLSADQTALEEFLQPAWKSCLVEVGPDFVILSRPIFQRLPLAQKRSMVRQAIGLLRPSMRDIDFSDIRRGLEFIEVPSSTGQVDLVSGLRLFVEGEKVFLAEWGAQVLDRNWPQLTPGDCLRLVVPTRVALSAGFIVNTRFEALPPVEHRAPFVADPFQVWLDAGSLTLPLTVRTRRPGDRFKPLGMEGHSQKLADFMINQHMPVRARAGWPLVCCGEQSEQIVWVPGYQPAYPFRLTDGTQIGLQLQIKQEVINS